MGEISRLHEADIVPFNPNDATQVSAELTNIVNNGVNDNWNRQGSGGTYAGTTSIVENATRLDAIDDEAGNGDLVDLQAQVDALQARIDADPTGLDDHEDRITVLEANPPGAWQIITSNAGVGNYNLTIEQVQANDMLNMASDMNGLNGNMYVVLPTVDSSHEGQYIKVYGASTGGIYLPQKYVKSSQLYNRDGTLWAGAQAKFASVNDSYMINCWVGKNYAGTYGWYVSYEIRDQPTFT